MKKFLFLMSAAVLAFSSCSNDNDSVASDLVEVSIPATGFGTNGTRTYINNQLDTISQVTFLEGEHIYAQNYYSGYNFKNIVKEGQTAVFYGHWNEWEGSFATILPYDAATRRATLNSITSTFDKANTDGTHYYVTLPNDQTCQATASGLCVSYDPKAGISFSYRDSPDKECYFFPAVSYLHFYSREETVTINASNAIAGDYIINYYGPDLESGYSPVIPADMVADTQQSGDITFTILNGKNTITAKGVEAKFQDMFGKVTSSGYYGYLVAIIPGMQETMTIGTKVSSSSHNFVPSNIYEIGTID